MGTCFTYCIISSTQLFIDMNIPFYINCYASTIFSLSTLVSLFGKQFTLCTRHTKLRPIGQIHILVAETRLMQPGLMDITTLHLHLILLVKLCVCSCGVLLYYPFSHQDMYQLTKSYHILETPWTKQLLCLCCIFMVTHKADMNRTLYHVHFL